MSQMPPPFPSESLPARSSEFQVPTERPTWPLPLGVFSIVWGSIGLVCTTCLIVMTVSTRAFMEWAGKMQAQGNVQGPQAIPTTPMPAEMQPGPISIVGAFIGPLGVIMLIVAGILLVRRSYAARGTHIAYAVISAVGTILGMIGLAMGQSKIAAYYSAHPDDPWTKFMQTQGQSQMLQGAVATCVSLVYPAFCLIWFGLVKRKHSDLTGGVPDEPLV